MTHVLLLSGLLAAFLLGANGQDLAESISSQSTLTWFRSLEIVTWLSWFLFIVTPIAASILAKKGIIKKKLLWMYMPVMLAAGSLTSLFSLFVLAMSGCH